LSGDHLSGAAITDGLKQPTRNLWPAPAYFRLLGTSP